MRFPALVFTSTIDLYFLLFKGEIEKKVDDAESTVPPAYDATQDPMSSHETSAPVLSREDQNRKYVTMC